MEPDTDKALMEIHSSPTAMVKQLCEIQHHLSSREGAWDWVQHLRLLSIRNIAEGPVRQEAFLDANLPTRKVRLKDRFEDTQKTYLAVSYRWSSQPDGLFKYKIQTRSAARPGRIAGSTLDRIIQFAAEQGYDQIWIDQECLHKAEDDHEFGVQAMDLVYEEAGLCVGVLNKTITEHNQLDG